MKRRLQVCFATVAIFLLLSACGGRSIVPLTDRSTGVRYPESAYRKVVRGDTLYSIAWESGRDYQELAAWNNIPRPYVIKPGQRLRLFPPDEASHRGAPTGSRTVVHGDTLYRIAREIGVDYRELATWNNIAAPYTIKPGQKLRLSPAAGTTARMRPSTHSVEGRSPRPDRKRSAGHAPGGTFGPWAWPADGNILARFDANGPNKGIDIGGKRGQTIRAAASGTVVYEGSGLRGYGQLIIIKHNAEFLSAYAHCDRTYVKEGNVIKRGAKIAEMGSTGADRVKLHFEIRRRGIPVDPIAYLPKT